MGRRGCRPRPCCRRRAQPPTDLQTSSRERRQAELVSSWERGGRARGVRTLQRLGEGIRRSVDRPLHDVQLAWAQRRVSSPRTLPGGTPWLGGGGAGRQVRTVAPCLVAGFAVFRHVVRPRAVLERALAAEARLGLLEALAVDGAADPRIPQRVQLAGGCCRGGLLSPSLAAPGAAGRGVHRAQPAAGAGRGRPISTRLG